MTASGSMRGKSGRARRASASHSPGRTKRAARERRTESLERDAACSRTVNEPPFSSRQRRASSSVIAPGSFGSSTTAKLGASPTTAGIGGGAFGSGLGVAPGALHELHDRESADADAHLKTSEMAAPAKEVCERRGPPLNAAEIMIVSGVFERAGGHVMKAIEVGK